MTCVYGVCILRSSENSQKWKLHGKKLVRNVRCSCFLLHLYFLFFSTKFTLLFCVSKVNFCWRILNLHKCFHLVFWKCRLSEMLLQLNAFSILVVLGVIEKEQPPEVFLKVLQNSQKNTCVRVQSCRPQTLAQMFFSEFWKMFKNNFFEEHLWASASE